MPDMTGVELAERIKQLFPTLPFVLLSGVNDLRVGSETADAFLSKLEGPEAMIDKIHSLLHQ
jgi:CheY-like chemotaxis protein